MHEDHDEIKSDDCKSRRTPYFPFYGDDWDTGTIGFTLEQRGFYLEVLRRMWDRKGGVPDDPKWIGAAVHCDPRAARRLRDFLVKEKKLVPFWGLLLNKRVVNDIQKYFAKMSARDRAKIAGRSAEDVSKLGQKFSEKPAISTQAPKLQIRPEAEAEADTEGVRIEVENITSVAATRGMAALPPREVLFEKLLKAGGKCLASEVNAPGLADMSIPLWWLEQGCDLERDIVAAIATFAAKREISAAKGRPVQNWNYFTERVTEFKANRERGLPTPAASSGHRPKQSFAQNREDARKRMLAREVAA